MKKALLLITLLALPVTAGIALACDAAKQAQAADAPAEPQAAAAKAGGCMPDGGCCGGSGGCAEAMKAEHHDSAAAKAGDDEGGCPCQRARKAKLRQQQEQLGETAK